MRAKALSFGVIYAIAPSPVEEGRIRTGTDDGLIQLTTDSGQNWTTITPSQIPNGVRDLLVHKGDLIAATQGCCIWVLDDVESLRELASADIPSKTAHLFIPDIAWRFNQRKFGSNKAKDYFTHYRNEGFIIRHGKERSPNSYYTIELINRQLCKT